MARLYLCNINSKLDKILVFIVDKELEIKI
jgi:hypothetical protein